MTRPRRPGVLTAASVLWILYGVTFVVIGVGVAASYWLPAISEPSPSAGQVDDIGYGLVAVGFGMLITVLGVFVLNGTTWARVVVMVVAAMLAILMIGLLIFAVVTIIASVLQFLPPVSRYVAATRQSTVPFPPQPH
jgi:hypothetical protein